MSTTEAFTEMISVQFIHRQLGVSSNYVRQIRHKMKQHPTDHTKWGVKLETMHQLLARAGYTLITKPTWHSPL